MQLNNIRQVDVSGKNILLRVDFNVTLENGDIKERFKMEAAKASIDYLLSRGARCVALVTHLGRPDGIVDQSLSLEQLIDDVLQVLGNQIQFVPECCGEVVQKAVSSVESFEEGSAKNKLWNGRVLLLENVRFHSGEKKNDLLFARELAAPFDVYVNDAFSVCHRDQASITGVTEYLPSYAGIHLQRELEILNTVKEEPKKPAVAVIGGAKIETKLPLIRVFEKRYDAVLVGGKVANEAIDSGFSFSDTVFLPSDFVGNRFDIGPETVKQFSEKIRQAKTVVWNGPMGKFEEERFSQGTREIAKAVGDADAFSVVGGGESVEALEGLGLMDEISFVSTGGGAMLDFLSEQEMPGLDVLMVQ